MKAVLALDQGTTSSRAILFSEKGEVLALSQNEFSQIYPRPGWVEHDPVELLYSQCTAAADAVRKSGISPKDIAAIGITNQRETTVVWDAKTGKPLYNAIVWQCRRTAELCEELKQQGLEGEVRQKTGLVIDAYFSGTKIKWILDHVEGARQRAEAGEILFGNIDSWLIWNLTGGKAHVTDYSNASRTMLFDIERLRWDESLCRALDIPMAMLPTPLPSSYVYGEVAAGLPGLSELAGIPIAGAAGDQPAALFGQGCFATGMMKNTYGTGCFFLMNTGERIVHSKNNLITSVGWGVDGKVEYALEGSVFNAGSVIKWLRDTLRIIDTADEVNTLAASIPDNGGVYFVPAFSGLGAPYWDMYTRGTLIGLTAGAGRPHIARATIESIAYQVTDLYGAMCADAGFTPTSLRVDGGASVSDILMQFQADMLNLPIDRPACTESTALGAAYFAGLGVGLWKNTDEIANHRRCQKLFTPGMEESRRAYLYSRWKLAVERAKNWAEH